MTATVDWTESGDAVQSPGARSDGRVDTSAGAFYNPDVSEARLALSISLGASHQLRISFEEDPQ